VLNLPLSLCADIIETPIFEQHQKEQEHNIKIQIAIIDRLNSVITGLNNLRE